MRVTGAAAAMSCALLALAGCGDERSGQPTGGASETASVSPVLTEAGDVLVRCGSHGLAFRPSAMTDGVDGLIDPAVVAAVLDDANDLGLDAPLQGQPASDVTLTVLAGNPAVDPTEVLIAIGDWDDHGPADEVFSTAILTRQDGEWSLGGWGGCDLEPALAKGPPLDADSGTGIGRQRAVHRPRPPAL